MREYLLQVKKLGEPTYLPAPEQGEPHGLWRRVVKFQSLDIDDAEKDEIVGTLWDYQAVEYNLQVGDKVIATLQFRIFHNSDGSAYQHVDVVAVRVRKHILPFFF